MENANLQLKANFVDIPARRIYPTQVTVENGLIANINETATDIDPDLPFLIPGFIDAHVHIESSMLIPSEFARLAVVHGTIATVSDPHEIANVCGVDGVHFMIENANNVPFHFFFGAPSCVPATSFETAGATIDSSDIEELMANEDIWYLSEMMNYPGVIAGDPEVIAKIRIAKTYGKPVDGHAPGLMGELLIKYFIAGISTDHECFTEAEALEKLKLGMKVIIREGSAARNFDSLIPLLPEWYEMMMFCSDDKHPDSLVEGHINQLCARAVDLGLDLFKILQVACLNPIDHYQLPLGKLRIGDPADFVLLKNMETFEVDSTYLKGIKVAESGKSLIASAPLTDVINRFECHQIKPEDLILKIGDYSFTDGKIPVIEVVDGALITNKLELKPKIAGDDFIADPKRDLLKIVVVNRYESKPPAVAFIRNFGITNGAIASSVAHDSHNIVAVGSDDEHLAQAISMVIDAKGGISCVGNGKQSILPLPVAGLMSQNDGYEIAKAYSAIDQEAKALGSTLRAPFMSLSFMALLVIPHLKLSDLGLFDADSFRFL